jgi:chromosome segregation ATPase
MGCLLSRRAGILDHHLLNMEHEEQRILQEQVVQLKDHIVNLQQQIEGLNQHVGAHTLSRLRLESNIEMINTRVSNLERPHHVF